MNKNKPDLTTKTGIKTYINNHWQEYGYTAKPTKYIALSFDDGPCSPTQYGGTAAMLKALEAVKVKATFFVLGCNVRDNKEIAQAIFDAGHELANHADIHINLGEESINMITASLNAASLTIKEITGENPRLFRAPYLNHGTNLSQVCENLGMALIDGSGHNDWPGSSAAIKTSVLANPQDGDIIILHENNTSQGNSMAVLPDIIKSLREKGFWIMTVTQLAAIKETPLKPGTRYNSF